MKTYLILSKLYFTILSFYYLLHQPHCLLQIGENQLWWQLTPISKYLTTSLSLHGLTTKCAWFAHEAKAPVMQWFHQKVREEQWRTQEPDVQAHRVGSAQITNTFGKQRLQNTWYVSLR